MDKQRSRWPRGRTLGGSSVLNYMLYIRGNKRDYDHWVQQGAYGWSWEEVFPYFLRSEDNRDPSIAYNGKSLPLSQITTLPNPLVKAILAPRPHLFIQWLSLSRFLSLPCFSWPHKCHSTIYIKIMLKYTHTLIRSLTHSLTSQAPVSISLLPVK